MQEGAEGDLVFEFGYLLGRGLGCLLVVGVLAGLIVLVRRLSQGGKAQPSYPVPPYPHPPQQPAPGWAAPAPPIERKISLWSRNSLYVTAVLRPDGSLVFLGQDLNPGNPWHAEYEYAITVGPADLPRLVAALGGGPHDDVLALLAANAEYIFRVGEQAWVRSLGIEPGFWSHVGAEL